MFFSTVSDDHAYIKLQRAVSTPSLSEKEVFNLIRSAAYDMIEEAEKLSLHGNVWHSFIAMSLIRDENVLGHLAEFSDEPGGSIFQIARQELSSICKNIGLACKIAKTDISYGWFETLADYMPSKIAKTSIIKDALEGVADIAKAVEEVPVAGYDPSSSERLCMKLISFYRRFGSGIFSLDYAFRWSAELKKLCPIDELDPVTFADLVGYESQKSELKANTEHFLNKKQANNVLLYGDSGTGKSSSIRSLLNEPGYVDRGLRIIELHKGQLQDIPLILDIVRKRAYRFIIFMDDLSFEDFEVDYKYLKAVIEGGIDRKPENILVYATSNRRNFIRQMWSDRKMSSDDVHGADTMQEKLSLADRFGVTIWYGSCNKDEYMDIVEKLAEEAGVQMDTEDLKSRALRWEIARGGFTGRSASQFVKYLMAENGRQ